MKVKVKICGIRSLEAAHAAVAAGADFLGFNFVPSSKRYIKLEMAKEIIKKLNNIKIVGVFQNEKLEVINKLINYLNLDYVQLHGSESPQYCQQIKKVGLIKAFRAEAVASLDKYKADYFLLKNVNLGIARVLAEKFPVMLAGGLTAENVEEAVCRIRPKVVDVARGVETNGRKDVKKIAEFIHRVRQLGGYFGQFGGQFVPEFLYPALVELEEGFEAIKKDKSFMSEYKRLLSDYAGRPTPLYFAKNTSKFMGCKVYFKREDLLNGGSHKLNNALGQALLAKHLGKKIIVTETAAGMHGVATVMASRVVRLKCKVFMGAKDIERQKLNYEKIRLLGGEVIPVERGNGVLKDAVSEALVSWIRDLPKTHYLMGSTVGSHPFPKIVAYFQKVIGEETREQILKSENLPAGKVGRLPTAIIACGSGGSNALGIFQEFIKDHDVKLVFVEGEESAAFKYGSVGVFQGTKTYVLQDEFGMDRRTASRAAGLNYPGRGPQLSFLTTIGRVKTTTANNEEVLRAYKIMAQMEGLLPAFETCHAIVELFKRKGKYKSDDIVILNFSGRGDKDI